MARRTLSALVLLLVSFLAASPPRRLAASPADGGGTRASGCGARDYAYAGVQGDVKAHGVAATIAAVANQRSGLLCAGSGS